MKKLLVALISLFFACGLRAQTQGFTNINIRGVGTVVSGGSLVIASGATFSDANLTTNQLLYCNSSGNLVPLTLGSGISIVTGTLTVGSSTSANPTQLVGTTTINGSATSFMRSDAAPGINLAMVPVWTGLHTFSVTAVKTSGTDYGMEILPTLNQRNATNFSLIYGNETITQAGSGLQYFLEMAVGGADAFDVSNTGIVTLGTWNGVAVASLFGGTGLTTFPIGVILSASSANTWSALNPGTINYILTSGGTGAVSSYQPITTILDSIGTPAQGDLLVRGASNWAYLVASSTAGQALVSAGAGATPVWASVPTIPGSTTAHDVASYSNTAGGLEDTGVASFTSTTAMNIAGNDGSGAGVLRAVNGNNGGSTFFYSGSFLDPSMAVSGEELLAIGVAIATNNAAYFGFHYAGSGSASNYASIGFSGNADLFTVTGAGLATTKALTATGAVIMNVGTASTTTGTGTLVVTGGVGVSGQISSGALVVFNGATAASVQGCLSAGNTAYSYGAPSSTGAAAVLIPATTYTLTGGSPANFQATYVGVPTFTDATSGTMAIGATVTIAGAPVGAGSLSITAPYSLRVIAGNILFGGNLVVSGGIDSTAIGATIPSTFAGTTGSFTGTVTLTGTVNQTAGQSNFTGTSSGNGNYINQFAGTWTAASNGDLFLGTDYIDPAIATAGKTGLNVNTVYINTPSVTGGGSISSGAQLTIAAPASGQGALSIASGTVNLGTGLTTTGSITNNGVTVLAAKITTYNGVATSGWGVPAIYGTNNRAVGATGATASLYTYTVGAADGTFEVDGNVLVTTSTLYNFTMTVTYTDESNTSRTLTLTFSQITGTLLTAITNATGAGAYEGVPLHIRCKASTTITFATVGTFTTVTYNAEGIVKQEG